MPKLLNRLTTRKRYDGFTLIELVIVVVIVGILTAIAIPSYGAIQKAATLTSLASSNKTAYSARLAELSASGADVGKAKYTTVGNIDDGEVATSTWGLSYSDYKDSLEDAYGDDDESTPTSDGASEDKGPILCAYSEIRKQGAGGSRNVVGRVGGDPICHLMFNESTNWDIGYGAAEPDDGTPAEDAPTLTCEEDPSNPGSQICWS